MAIITACNSRSYNVKTSRSASIKDLLAPPGMVYVPSGTVTIAEPGDTTNKAKYRLSAFYMDRTPITNKQYRQFVYWVRDSIALTDYLKDKRYFHRRRTKDTIITANINWDKVGDGRSIWKSKNYKIIDKLRPMFNNEQLGGSSDEKLNIELLQYRFETPSADKIKPGPKVIKELVNVWPDENVWDKDFPNSQNDLMTKSYFTNQSFDDYPVIGVTWKQARAFAAWRSKVWKAYNYKMKNPRLINLPMDLPTEAQRAYVSVDPETTKDVSYRDSISGKKIKAKQTVNLKSEAQSNFSYTMPVMSAPANKFGLYNTTGNVSEWTLNSYSNSWTAFVHKINPVLLYDAKDSDNESLKRKVVIGTSWKDQGMLSPDDRQAKAQDESQSYVGFRCVMLAPDFNMPKTTNKSSRKLKNL